MRKVFRIVFVFTVFASLCITAEAQPSDPLAELEAWNKIKESSVAADYHDFMQKFPNGSLAARAREKMNTLGDPVWNELKKSNDPFKYRDYIKANPNSPFLDQAKARLEVLTVATIEWEKLKAAGDGTAVMQFIKDNPSHPFVEEAKADIENSLWEEIVRTGEERLLEFYALHYSTTERGKEAASKLQTRRAAKREQDLLGIRGRIAALNGVKATLHHSSGAAPTEYWYENKVVDVCTLETTEFVNETYNRSLDYGSKFYRIDLNKVRRVDPGSSTNWGFGIAVSGGASDYRSPGDIKFSGIYQYFTRKSTSKPFQFHSSLPLSETYVVVLRTYDSNVASRFAADLNALVSLCKASK